MSYITEPHIRLRPDQALDSIDPVKNKNENFSVNFNNSSKQNGFIIRLARTFKNKKLTSKMS